MEHLRLQPFKVLPILVHEGILRFVDAQDLLNCRLVCSEWYKNISKIFKHPNCFSIGGERRTDVWTSLFSKKRELKKSFSMKCYEDPLSPVQVLNIQSLSFLSWRSYFQKSEDFQQIITNITELTLKNIRFHNRKMLIKLLNSCGKVKHVAIHHCSFDAFQKREYKKLLSTGKTNSIDELCEISSVPKVLDIEMKENSRSMSLVLEMFSTKLKEQSLEDIRLLALLPVIDSGKKYFSYFLRLRNATEQFQYSRKVLKFLESALSNHCKTLKYLNINWQAIKYTTDITSTHGQPFLMFTYLEELCNIFYKLAVSDENLKLRRLEIDLGRIYCFNDIHFTPGVPRELCFLPFLDHQIERGLREIHLGKLTTIGYPLSLMQLLGIANDDFLVNIPKDLRLKYDHMFVGDGTKATLNSFHRGFDHTFLLKIKDNNGCCMQKNEIVMTNDSQSPEGIVEHFREYLWNYDLPIESNYKLREDYYDFLDLTELIIVFHVKQLKSFNVSTICYLCPFLTKLKITDGPEFNYAKNKNGSSQYGGMSHAVFNDYDMKFIFSSLIDLKELVIWANMSAVSDRAFIHDPHLFCKENNSASELDFDAYESYQEVSHMVNLYYKESTESIVRSYEDLPKDTRESFPKRNADFANEFLFTERKSLVSASISNLPELTRLSLRGVGNKISKKILSSRYGLRTLKKLKYLEILGTHKISEEIAQRIMPDLKESRFS